MKQSKHHEETPKRLKVKFAFNGVYTTLIFIITLLAIAVWLSIAWFLSNTQVSSNTISIFAQNPQTFLLATVGTEEQGAKEQGVYDKTFGLLAAEKTETIDGVVYYTTDGNASFHVRSNNNLNNYMENADVRPGNRGRFDLYIICKTTSRELTLNPVLSLWYEDTETDEDKKRTAEELFKGHFLLFSNMDEKGMYSGNLDWTQPVSLNLDTCKASQGDPTSQEGREFSWGYQVYPKTTQDDPAIASDDPTAVYCLPVYWVWPEEFGNFIYTGNAYNKNLFSNKNNQDYVYFKNAMNGMDSGKFFQGIPAENRPNLEWIISPESIPDSELQSGKTRYQIATEYYDDYSKWYNDADEIIGNCISYIELGFSYQKE